MSKEKYSVVESENAYYIADNEEDVLLNVAVVVNRLNNYEHRLAKCIEPKFKIGQEVWFISLTDNICNFEIEDLQFTLCGDGKSAMCYYDKNNVEHFEFNLFATEEEAKAKLEELKNA